VPSGATTIWLLIVCSVTAEATMLRAGSQVAPRSVVRAKYVGPPPSRFRRSQMT
jgi:hypothetical protein